MCLVHTPGFHKCRVTLLEDVQCRVGLLRRNVGAHRDTEAQQVSPATFSPNTHFVMFMFVCRLFLTPHLPS